jgi:hypothetical protein
VLPNNHSSTASDLQRPRTPIAKPLKRVRNGSFASPVPLGKRNGSADSDFTIRGSASGRADQNADRDLAQRRQLRLAQQREFEIRERPQ